MNVIGLFEAKTKFSELCQQVAAKREPVVVTRRGKPLVKIEPVRRARSKTLSVWDLRARHVREHGPMTEDFTLPKRGKQTWRNPVAS